MKKFSSFLRWPLGKANSSGKQSEETAPADDGSKYLSEVMQEGKKLDLKHRDLPGVPPAIWTLSSLTWLSLAHNSIEILPAQISRLSSLGVLRMFGNRLLKLPPEISFLRNLQILDLGKNMLAEIGMELASLTTLIELDANWNQIGRISPAISRLTLLQTLNLYINRLGQSPVVRTFPISILSFEFSLISEFFFLRNRLIITDQRFSTSYWLQNYSSSHLRLLVVYLFPLLSFDRHIN
jgi:Leucine-rich repeat (LRR) protein